MSTSVAVVLVLCNRGSYTKAIDLASQLSPNLLDEPVLANVVAICYFKLGEFSRSIDLLTALESIFYNDVDFLTLYAATARRLGDFEKSEISKHSNFSFFISLYVPPELIIFTLYFFNIFKSGLKFVLSDTDINAVLSLFIIIYLFPI